MTTADKQTEHAGSSPYRFNKQNRLPDAAAFGRVFKKASRSRDALFTVLCRENNSVVARLGLAISKKHCRRATARNRIKRIVRESFRENQQALAGLDVVIINQRPAATANNKQLFESLAGHWEKSLTAIRQIREQEKEKNG